MLSDFLVLHYASLLAISHTATTRSFYPYVVAATRVLVAVNFSTSSSVVIADLRVHSLEISYSVYYIVGISLPGLLSRFPFILP